ncbi:unnamed protein product [Rhodiola kirilowii]
MSGGELPRKEANVLKGHEGAVLAARFNSDGNYCLTGGKDRTIRLWNPHRGIHIKTYKSHGREVRDVHVTQDNSKLCSCGGDRQVFYWDVATGRVIRKFRGHDSEVNAVKFNEYSSVVVSAGYDRSVRAWDCRSHSTEPIQIIDTFSDSVMSCCLTKTEIIAGSVDGTVRTFDIRMGRELSDSLGQPVNCIALSNDGNCILASCLDSTLRLIDRTTGELLQEYKGHKCKSYKLDCCLTNTDAHITGGSEDGFIYFWDLVDAKVVSSFRAHASVGLDLGKQLPTPSPFDSTTWTRSGESPVASADSGTEMAMLPRERRWRCYRGVRLVCGDLRIRVFIRFLKIGIWAEDRASSEVVVKLTI